MIGLRLVYRGTMQGASLCHQVAFVGSQREHLDVQLPSSFLSSWCGSKVFSFYFCHHLWCYCGASPLLLPSWAAAIRVGRLLRTESLFRPPSCLLLRRREPASIAGTSATWGSGMGRSQYAAATACCRCCRCQQRREERFSFRMLKGQGG